MNFISKAALVPFFLIFFYFFQLLAVNYFRINAALQMFDWVLNTLRSGNSSKDKKQGNYNFFISHVVKNNSYCLQEKIYQKV